jgi:Family of unknown function (DUF6526)
MIGVMADKPQSFRNHTRLDPLFHQFLGPLSFILLIGAVTSLVRNVSWTSAFQVVAAIWAVVATFKIRLYALKVQDRVIRLEERLRMHELFTEPLKSRIGEFTESQLIALRFASDTELPALAEKALQGLKQKQIKAAIKTWRPDYFRV